MKPFTLNDALAGKPVIIREGRRANQHAMNLFMGPEKRYMNVYQGTSGLPKLGFVSYESASEAAGAAKTTNLKLISTICYEV